MFENLTPTRPINLFRQPIGMRSPAILDRLDAIQVDVELHEQRRARDACAAERYRKCLRTICLDLFDAIGPVTDDIGTLLNGPEAKAGCYVRGNDSEHKSRTVIPSPRNAGIIPYPEQLVLCPCGGLHNHRRLYLETKG